MKTSQLGQSLPKLVEIMQKLLSEDGCPWDREQNFQTLRPYVIEEAYEVVEAIDGGNPNELREELGDLLLQIVFQSELARAKGWFGPDDVIEAISSKLIKRHPHVFGDEKLSTSEEVLQQWEKRKLTEKENRGALDGVPKAMPALLRAQRVGEKASRFGYDWPNVESVRDKVTEELRELDEALLSRDAAKIESELGDVFFALASLGRKENIDAEAALRGTLDRFSTRFSRAENVARAQGKTLDELTDAERDAIWNDVKKMEV